MKNIFLWDENGLGGTEIALKWFHKNILEKMKNIEKYRCISVPGAPQQLEELFDGKRNIVWLHLLPNQINDNGINLLKRKDFIDTVECFIVISNFHKKQTVLQLDVNPNKVYVIEYPLYETMYNEKKFENVNKVKIIHASQPSRGLDILLQSVLQIKEEFELEIHNDFYPEKYNNPELDKILEDERITFYGKTPHKTLMKKFSESHIHAYPSIFEETSCLVQAEALASGNLCVYSNVGVLPETSLGHGIMVDFISKQSIEEIVKDYADSLRNAINMIKNNEFDPSEQIKDISLYRKKDKIIQKWLDFDKSLA